MNNGLDYNLVVSIVAAGIALLALIRPEIGKLFRYWFNSLLFYPSGRLELGFSDWGPTIGISGTLRSNGGLFVSKVEIKLIRQRDQATYLYSWTVFRDLDYLQLQNSKLDIASAFSLRDNEAKSINIMFADTTTQELYRDKLLDISTKFKNFARSRVSPTNDLDAVRRQFETQENPLILELFGILGRSFYWEAGAYKVEIKFITDKPQKMFIQKYSFALSQEQVTELDNNRIGVIQASLLNRFNPNFAYVVYSQID